jgi:hypothetical protein
MSKDMHRFKHISRFVIVLFSLQLLVQFVEAQVFEHPGGLHSRTQLETARIQIAAGTSSLVAAFEALLEQANLALERSPKAVEDFSVPGYYRDAKGHREVMGWLSDDSWAAYSCAIAYQLIEGNERIQYAEKASELLTAWARTNKRTSNDDGDLAMADAGAGLVFAAELLSHYDGWNKEEREAFKKWITNVYLISCQKIADRANNWGDWGMLGCIASHYLLDDKKGLDADIENIRKKIDKSIAADGHLPHETKRGKRGIWYTYFSLAPLTAACEVAANARGVDLYHFRGEDGAGIERALDYLLQYCREPERWPHYQQNDLRLANAKGYPGNLFEAMHGIYGKSEYESWIEDSRPIMVHGHHYAWAVPTLLRTVPPHEKVKERLHKPLKSTR